MRMLFRSNHVYILLTAVMNGAFAIDLQRRTGWQGRVQLAGSLALAVAPLVLTVAFFVEPHRIGSRGRS